MSINKKLQVSQFEPFEKPIILVVYSCVPLCIGIHVFKLQPFSFNVDLHVLKLHPSSLHQFSCFQAITLFLFVLVIVFSNYTHPCLHVGIFVLELLPSSFSRRFSCSQVATTHLLFALVFMFSKLQPSSFSRSSCFWSCYYPSSYLWSCCCWSCCYTSSSLQSSCCWSYCHLSLHSHLVIGHAPSPFPFPHLSF